MLSSSSTTFVPRKMFEHSSFRSLGVSDPYPWSYTPNSIVLLNFQCLTEIHTEQDRKCVSRVSRASKRYRLGTDSRTWSSTLDSCSGLIISVAEDTEIPLDQCYAQDRLHHDGMAVLCINSCGVASISLSQNPHEHRREWDSLETW